MKKTLFWKIFGGYLAIVAVFAAAVLAVSFPRIRNIYIQDQVRHLESLAGLLEERVLKMLDGEELGGIDRFAKTAGRSADARITVIDPEGRVLADSERDPQTMENHAYRPEVLAAIQGQKDWNLRFSSTVGERMLYMGFPLVHADGRAAGVLRLSVFVRELQDIISHLQGNMLRAVGIVAGVVLLAALLFSRGVTRPIGEFLTASERVAGGDFDVKLSIRRKGEFRAFAESFNAMTNDLKDMFSQLEFQKQELDSVLTSIREGLVVIDKSDRIVLSNPAFRRMPGIPAPDERFFWEVVRNTAFVDLIRRVREGRKALSEEIDIGGGWYLCNASWLEAQEKIVATFHDMTQARKVEKIKREFVVNVSHELRTPLTAIKGFVETLEARASEEDRKYIAIVQRNTDRLIRIVEDLLNLSELEEKGLPKDIGEIDVSAVAEHVLKIFEPKARDKGLAIELRSPSGLPLIKGDVFQLEQMFVNIVDNAVKYTEKGSVNISLDVIEGSVIVEVADTGIGIPAGQRDRVFERFYVVDTSRSKKLGGTGLGLSIVKHIVLAHNGTIDIRSEEGRGTTVRVTLPVGASSSS
jgi:two-component system, OmpR family, phosphate regulon sensor histidine kinase PhoR